MLPLSLFLRKNILFVLMILLLYRTFYLFMTVFTTSYLVALTLVWDVHDHNTFANEMGMLYAPEVNYTTMYDLHSLSKKCVVSWNIYTRIYTRNLSSNLNNLSRAQLQTKISQYMIDKY